MHVCMCVARARLIVFSHPPWSALPVCVFISFISLRQPCWCVYFYSNSMASSASVPSRTAAPQWTLIQVLRYWLSTEPGPEEEDEGEEEESTECLKRYMLKLAAMGVTTRLQAQSVLTDELCRTLDETYGVSCDVRRELLDLLGVEWRQQVWSDSEIAVWQHSQVEPTAPGEQGSWREEVADFRKLMFDLGFDSYIAIFHDDVKYVLLGIATARNLLYYLCDADFDRVGIPTHVRKSLRTEALCRITGMATGGNVCPCIGYCKCVAGRYDGVVGSCRHGSRQKLPNGRWYVFVGPDPQAPPPILAGGRRQTSMQTFRVQVQELRAFLDTTGNEYPKQHDEYPDVALSSTMSAFVNQQRVLHKKGKLDEERIGLLQALPGWCFDARSKSWKEMYDAALGDLQRSQRMLAERSQRMFTKVAETLRYPSKSSLQPAERKIGQWLADQRKEFAIDEAMSAERRALLQKLPGWSAFAKKDGGPKRQSDDKHGVSTKRCKTGGKPSNYKHADVQKAVEVLMETGMAGGSDSLVAVPYGTRLRSKTSPADALKQWFGHRGASYIRSRLRSSS